MVVKYTVNSEEFDKAVKDALKNITDLTPAFIQISREFYKTNRAIFTLKSAGKYVDFVGKKIAQTWQDPGRPEKRTRNGTYTGYQWFKERTKGFKKGYPLLKYTGRLEQSIINPSSPDTINVITKKSVVLGTSVEYGVYHNSDESRKSNLPMRPFLFLDPSTTIWAGNQQFSRRNEAWVKAIETYTRRAMGAMYGES